MSLPTDISNLTCWYDASDDDTLTESGGQVTQWDDKSGNGFHLVDAAATHNRPSADGSMGPQSIQAMAFDGADFIECPATGTPNVDYPDVSGDMSCMMSIQWPLAQDGVIFESIVITSVRWFLMWHNSTKDYRHWAATYQHTSNQYTDYGTPHLLLVTIGSTDEIWIDGVQDDDGASPAGTPGLEGLIIGSRLDHTYNHVPNGTLIGEIAFWNKNLSASERASMFSHFSRWTTLPTPAESISPAAHDAAIVVPGITKSILVG